MKLWDKGKGAHDLVHSFTVGNDNVLDQRLAAYDVIGSIAHVQMLTQIGIIKADESEILVDSLNRILAQTRSGDFAIPDTFEDIHSYVEYLLTDAHGELGKKIHTGRSRNDQVLVDLHLYLKDVLKTISHEVIDLSTVLLDLARDHKDVFLPGYTHTQVAMPSSFGLWFSAYAEILCDDLIAIQAAYEVTDQNPLGSGAGFGTSFPLDRQLTTDLLGFRTLKYNSIAAQMGRGRLEKVVANALASVAATMNKLSADIVLYMSQNFGFIAFPDELTTGSSIMPHKKNPDVFELIRAKCNLINTVPAQLTSITQNLTSGYHRDFQLLKEPLFQAIDETLGCLQMCNFALPQIIVRDEMANDARYKYVYTVDAVNELVMQGVSFRDAYVQVGKSIDSGHYAPPKEQNYTHAGSIGNLSLDEIKQKLDACASFLNAPE